MPPSKSLREAIDKILNSMIPGERMPLSQFIREVEMERVKDDDGAVLARLAWLEREINPKFRLVKGEGGKRYLVKVDIKGW